MLVFFLSGDQAKQISTWSIDQIKADLLNALSYYVSDPINITNLNITKWNSDPFTLGSFSYAQVGTTIEHFQNLRSAIQFKSNNIWLIGEHIKSS